MAGCSPTAARTSRKSIGDVEPPPPPNLVAGDGVHWQTRSDYETGDLIVDQLGPESGRFVGRGRVPTGYDRTVFDEGYAVRSIAIGPDLDVFTAAERTAVEANLIHHSTKLFEVTEAG